MPRRGPSHYAWTGLALLGAVVVWNGLVGELLLSKPPIRIDPLLGTTYQPGVHGVHGREGYSRLVFDRHGFNNDDSDQAVDVLVLGDSHTEALQVGRADNYVSRTQALLEASGLKVRIYNAGFSARSAADYLALGHGYQETFRPRIVVVQLSRGDLAGDSIDPHRQNFLREEQGKWRLASRDGSPRVESLSLRLASAVPLFGLLGSQVQDGFGDTLWGVRSPFLPVTKERAARSVPQPAVDLENLARAEIGGLKALFGEQLIVLFLRYTPALDSRGSLRPTSDADEEAGRPLRMAAEESQVLFLDTDKVFQILAYQHGRFPRGLFNGEPDSGHLNEAGHEAVAQELARELRERLR